MNRVFAAMLCVCIPQEGASGIERLAKHVVIVGLDGCRPEAIRQANAPVIQQLIREGAVCWKAQAVRPTVTQVNWAAMLTGCGPAKNGIDKHPVTEATLGTISPSTPSIFQVAAANHLSAAAFLGHWKLYALETETAGVHFVHSPYEARHSSAVAAEYLSRNRPALCFVYMGDLDGAGHKYGWLSREQLEVMTEMDAAVGKIVTTLRESGMWDSTLLMITSDHGGHDRSHSEGTAEDVTIPWIAAGPLVKAGAVIEH
jgi:predicted AlkP superfamily pyrophosphatase or phosphodiesterase